MKYQPGESGNPNGRPKGTGPRQQLFNDLVSPHKGTLINTALKLALDGNEGMLRLFLERLLPPKPIDDVMAISIPEGDGKRVETLLVYGESILRAATQGQITTEKADAFMRLIESQRKNIECTEIAARLAEIERTLKQRKIEKKKICDK